MKKGAKKVRYSYLENNIEKENVCSLEDTAYDEKLLHLLSTNQLLTIHSLEPNLGDIFMEITGRRLS